MSSKKMIPVLVPFAALLILAAAIMVAGAQSTPAVRIPPGEIIDSPNAAMSEAAKRPVPEAPALPGAPSAGAVETFGAELPGAFRGTGEGGTEWAARDGRLQQVFTSDGMPSYEPSFFVTKDAGFADGTIETYFYPTGGSPLGAVLRGSEAGYYRVTLHMKGQNDLSKALIEKVTGSQTQVLAEAPVSAFAGYELEQWQHLRVTAEGATITAYLGGGPIVTATGVEVQEGWAGLWTWADNGTQWDNLRIQRAAGR